MRRLWVRGSFLIIAMLIGREHKLSDGEGGIFPDWGSGQNKGLGTTQTVVCLNNGNLAGAMLSEGGEAR